MTVIVTGGAGFVAASLIARFLAAGDNVLALDNFCRGDRTNLGSLLQDPKLTLAKVDLADIQAFREALNAYASAGKYTSIWHLAANSDIPAGVADPQIDLRDTFLTTFNAQVISREFGIGKFYFASSSAIYGDFGEMEISENSGPLFPISNYGAMKLASEGQLSAAVESFLDQALLFRFPNVVGVPATHGVILDFVRKLQKSPNRLAVLGDGSQKKGYLHVKDLVDAMLHLARINRNHLDAFNIGPIDEGVTVRFIAECVVARVAPGAKIAYGTGNKGWVGDVPRFRYSTEKLQSQGWRPELSSEDAICRAVDEIATQEGM